MPNILKKIGWGLITIVLVTLMLMVAIAALSARASGQIIYGYAGTNVPENLTAETRAMLIEQVPAGGTLGFCFRNDKYTGNAPESDINNVIALNTELNAAGKYLATVYTMNARNAVTIDQNFYALNKFLAAGLQILAVRIGNEEWFKIAGHGSNWQTYINTNTALINAVETHAQNFTVIFPVAEPSWITWNTPAIAYINAKPNRSDDIHYYWGATEAPVYKQLVNDVLPSETVKAGAFLSSKNDFYSQLYTEITTSTHFDDVMQFHLTNFPGKKMFITEFGPGGTPGNVGGTFGFEAASDWFLNQINDYPEAVAIVCRFNGPSITGIITKKSTKDASILQGSYVKRLGYYTISNFLQHSNATEITTINKPGTYTFSVHNTANLPLDAETLIPLAQGLYFTSVEFDGITGANWYASSGVTQWWATGSDKFYEISGITKSLVIPAMSYGYVTVVVEEIPIYGCTDPEALNYNPLANSEDLSCYYQSDCGCGDKAALNYNANAICIDNSKCEYAPPPPAECLKKRWLFTSLGCKPSKRICDCN